MRTTTTRRISRRLIWLVGGIALAISNGCSTLTFKIEGIPACSLPVECRALPKRGLVPIDVTKLTQVPPQTYRLAPGDILGVTVDGIIPLRPVDGDPILPPVHFPEAASGLPPAIGVPIVVQESGVITLSALDPIPVTGLSLEETAAKIRDSYLAREIINRDDPVYPVVTLIRARSVNVTVIREDTGATSRAENTQEAIGGQIQLPAYRNDVLNALMATGGLPGLRAKNEIRIYRNGPGGSPVIAPPGSIVDATEYQLDHGYPFFYDSGMDGPETLIPLRVPAGMPIVIPPEDIILNEGDVVYIANRDTEVFYTGGLLPGGEHLLPRDYDIDIFEAMAIAGYSYGSTNTGGGGGGLVPSTGVAPTQLFIFRERADGTQYTIEIDLEQAVAVECERLLVKPGDKLLLRYSPREEALNFGIFAFFTYGIRELFR